MSHWFHRNPIKATGVVPFDIKAASNVEARQLCSDASLKRAKLLDLLCNPSLDRALVEEGVRHYFSILQGFIWEIAPDGSLLPTKDSKLRFAQKFKWVNSTDPNTKEPIILNDSMFELVSMLTNVGIWYTKHAACLAASKDNVSNDEAKQIHRALRTAAGIFTKVKEEYVGRLMDKPSIKGSDVDDQILLAYATQAQAEAQEVTFAHAVEQQHNAGLVAALGYEAARLYQAADASLTGIDEKRVGKWRKYLQFKHACYTSYAYSYEAEKRLAADECGYAIACVKEGGNWYLKGETIAKSYAGSAGVGTAGTKPLDHPFFRRLQPHLKRIYDKCERENTLIYHQKVPAEIPVLDLKPSFGLVAPEPFELPKCSETWNEKAINGFDLSKMSQGTKDGPQKEDKEDVKPAKEKPIENTDREPQNESGCLLM